MQSHRTPTIAKRDPQGSERKSSGEVVVASGKKFMLTLRPSVFDELRRVADERGVTIQGLIRAVIVPEWHLEHPNISTEEEEDVAMKVGERVMKQATSVSGWPRPRSQTDGADLRKVNDHNLSGRLARHAGQA
jgi:hypothetical protein